MLKFYIFFTKHANLANYHVTLRIKMSFYGSTREESPGSTFSDRPKYCEIDSSCPPTAGGKAVASEGKVNAEVASVPSVQLTTEQPARMKVLEIGPGMGVLSQYLLQRHDVDLRMIEIDDESVEYLESHFPQAHGRVIFGDFLKLDIDELFPEEFHVIGNFPYNISSQIFFRIIDYRNRIPQTVCMIQKEVAERIAEKPGSKTYGILSVLLQAWYDIEYLFTVGSGAFAPPPKVQSAVIRLTRNRRTSLGCDENAFKNIVKTAFGQRRKTLRNSLKPIIAAKATKEGWDTEALTSFTSAPVFELRPERLSVEDFIGLTNLLT